MKNKPNEAATKLCEALHEKLDYFRMEYDMSYAEVLGTLRILEEDLLMEMREILDEESE